MPRSTDVRENEKTRSSEHVLIIGGMRDKVMQMEKEIEALKRRNKELEAEVRSASPLRTRINK